MENNFQALKDATLGAAAIAPPPSTLGASQGPELANMYRSTFQLPLATGAVSAAANTAGDIVAEQKRQAAIAAQKQKDQADPKSYKKVKKDDGGFDFFDSDGNQVDIATLAKRTNTKASDWIDDSENPIDIQYKNDYKNLQDLLNAVSSRDTKKVESFQQSFKDEGLPDITQQKPQDIIDQFKQYYERYYTPREQNPNAWGVTPNNAPYVPAAHSGTSYGVGTPTLSGD